MLIEIALGLHVFTSAAPAAGSQPVTGFLDRTLRLGQTSHRYQVYVPVEFDPGRSWPVILFLHGAGERGSDGLKPTQVGVGTAIRMDRDRFPAIAVFPQVSPEGAWVGDMARVASLALDLAIAEFHGDPERIYLTGISMGGYGTWYMGFDAPERFAALVPVCGGIVPPPGRPLLRQLPATAGAADPYAAAASRLKEVPAWVFHGAEDAVIPASESRRIVEALKKAGGDVRYTEYKDVEHNSWDRAYAEPELWTWLFAQRRRVAQPEPAGRRGER